MSDVKSFQDLKIGEVFRFTNRGVNGEIQNIKISNDKFIVMVDLEVIINSKEELLSKISRIVDHAYPVQHSDVIPEKQHIHLTWGF